MKPTFIVILITFTVALAACQPAVDNSNSGNAESPKRLLTVDHTSVGKPKAPVDVRYELQGKPILSTPLKIKISIKPLMASRSLKIYYTTQGAIAALDSVTEMTFHNPVAEQTFTHTIEILPQDDGQHYVNVFITLEDNDGMTQTSTLMIPVGIGEKTNLKPEHPNKAYLQQDNQGNPIISLPADETRKPK